MKKRGILVLVLLIAIFATSSLFAASTFSVGSVNYYSYQALENEDTEDYIPGLRGEFFFSEYLGVSADALLLPNSDIENDIYWMMYIIDVVFRLPLGLVEPYIATGPAYLGVIVDGESVVADSALAYNVRGGVDFNILAWLSLGSEANFGVNDVVEFFENIDIVDEDYFKENSLIGISAKIKF